MYYGELTYPCSKVEITHDGGVGRKATEELGRREGDGCSKL